MAMPFVVAIENVEQTVTSGAADQPTFAHVDPPEGRVVQMLPPP
jgi:hypothetical protein